jgi:hypothetical protein
VRLGQSLLAAVALAVCGAQSAQAQSEPASCANTRTGALSTPPRAGALESLMRCPSTGPSTLVQLWAREGPRDKMLRSALVEASGALRDARVFEELLRVTRRSQSPLQDRLASLRALLRLYDPSYSLSEDYLLSDAPRSTLPRSTEAAEQTEGSSQLPSDYRLQVGRELARLAGADGDPSMRRAALHIRQALAFSDPVNTPVAAGAVTLLAACRNAVKLRSVADIDLPVQVHVLGTANGYRSGIKAPQSSAPTELLLAFPAGTVVATYGGREIARLNERNGPCTVGR